MMKRAKMITIMDNVIVDVDLIENSLNDGFRNVDNEIMKI
mgnify:CR=1 FL=1